MKDKNTPEALERISTQTLSALFQKYQRQQLVSQQNPMLVGKIQFLAQVLGVREMIAQIVHDAEALEADRKTIQARP
jgi:hypothetical protein